MTEIERILSKEILRKDFLKPETRKDFIVDSELKKIWLVQLDLLYEFDRICRENDIKYCLMFGSLLGAVRHSGYIPWDDDLDVVMFREDYEKLIKIKNLFKEPYFLQIPIEDDEYFYSVARIRNSNTSAIDNIFAFRNFNMGIFIDVNILDEINEEEGRKKFQKIDSLIIKNSTYMRANNPYLDEKNKKRVKEYVYENPINVYNQIEMLMTEDNGKGYDKVACTSGTVYGYERDLFCKKDFYDTIECSFEGIKTFIPKGYDNILKVIYGDYMTYPPINKRVRPHSTIIFDPDVPYKEKLQLIRSREME